MHVKGQNTFIMILEDIKKVMKTETFTIISFEIKKLTNKIRIKINFINQLRGFKPRKLVFIKNYQIKCSLFFNKIIKRIQHTIPVFQTLKFYHWKIKLIRFKKTIKLKKIWSRKIPKSSFWKWCLIVLEIKNQFLILSSRPKSLY